MSTVPFGSATRLGRMAKKLKLNAADWGLTQDSTLSYAIFTSEYAGPMSSLVRDAMRGEG